MAEDALILNYWPTTNLLEGQVMAKAEFHTSGAQKECTNACRVVGLWRVMW